jgi:purine-binding chemotaxis protein CheW
VKVKKDQSGSLDQPQTYNKRDGIDRQYVVFKVNQHSYALPLKYITRAFRMVAITPIPDAPLGVQGMINIAGHAAPAINLRLLFGLEDREPELSDRLLVLEAEGDRVILMVDEVMGVIAPADAQFESSKKRGIQSKYLTATIQHPDGLIMALDVNRLLSL